jgi:hypothetical protein
MNPYGIPDFTDPEFTDYGAPAALPDFTSPEFTEYGPPPPARRTFMDDVAEGTGSAVRGAYKGVLGLPALVTDPLVAAINEAFGTDFVQMGEGVDMAADRLGVPRLEGRPGQLIENLAGAGAGGITGAGLMARAAAIPANTQGVPASVLRTLGERPLGQGAAAGAGAYGAHVAKEHGAGEGGQLAAGMAAATLAPAVGGAGSMARSLATSGGRYDTAAQALRALAHDPDAALARLDDSIAGGQRLRAPKTDPSVPPFRPMTATESADPGLLAIHETVRGMPGQTGRFVQQETQNNQALLGFLARKFGPERAQLIAKREAAIGGRIKELAQKSRPTNPTPFMAKLDALEMVPRGQDVEARAVVSAVRKEFDTLFERGGYDWITNPMYLYQGPRKTINAMIESKSAGDTPLTKNSQALLLKLRDSLDQVIDDGMPGFRDYWMRPYAKMSAAAERREIFDDLVQRASATAQTDLKGAPMVQASRFETAMRNAAKQHGNQPSDFARLTPGQKQALVDVQAELRKGAMLGAARMRGSDTFKNMTMGALVGRLVAGGGLGDDAPKWVRMIADKVPVKLTGGADEEVISRLADALLDPEMAKHLLVRANAMSADSFAKAMTRRMTAATVGAGQVE